ncbi:hypothetical protein SAMN04488503_1260 [Humidesulfovibrio mexicanus]|uniref:DUF456 domain-containing protein n=1 Tax=Humidesulfovibrio mexicanus TaxID=147047 RepID=A0A238Z6M8_9BACT|nr:DUF456 domain-containing protein [Humidesulfovibrio mexicanus]SNR78473.1 hypothetical protein SAMN04488503_1260 [Humidesulfovibrio mexicanus]
MLDAVAGLALGLVLFALLWLNLLSLPGNWLMLGVLALLAAFGPEGRITWSFVGMMSLLALLGEGIEFVAQIIGGKRGGASGAGNFGGVVGSIAGAILGAPFGLGLGAIAGALVGAWLGCFAVERLRRESHAQAAQAAWGSFWGRSLGLVGKAAVGAVIIVMSVARFTSQAA